MEAEDREAKAGAVAGKLRGKGNIAKRNWARWPIIAQQSIRQSPLLE